jgi:hypothetical protein
LNSRWAAIAAAVSLMSVACAQPTLYSWGDYEDGIHELYKHPESEREFHDDLAKLLLTAKKKGKQPPPGVAAELGFLEYRAGQYDQAIAAFDLERQSWPESGTLMTKIIERVEQEKHKGEPADAASGADASAASGGVDQPAAAPAEVGGSTP